MFIKFHLILVQLVICTAISNRSKGYVNEPRCNVTVNTGMRYYVTTHNVSKYVECVAKNWGIEQFCDKGTFFNVKMVSCMIPENSTLKFKVTGASIYENIANNNSNNNNNEVNKRWTQTNQLNRMRALRMPKRDVDTLNSQINNLIDSLLCHLNYTENNCDNQTVNSTQIIALNSTANQSIDFSNTLSFNETNNISQNSLNETEFKKRDVEPKTNPQTHLEITLPCQLNKSEHNCIDNNNNRKKTMDSSQHLELNSTSSQYFNSWNKTALKVKSICRYLLKGFKSSKCLCLNGVCNEFSTESECICWPGYKGNSCEISLNQTIDTKWSHLLNSSFFTFNEQSNYKVYWTELIENLWSDLSSEHLFVKNFNFTSSHNESILQSSYQKFYVYSKQVSFKFLENMKTLENSLEKIVNFTQQNNMHLVKEEASKFMNELKNISMKQTHINNNYNNNSNSTLKPNLVDDKAVETFKKNDFKNRILKELNMTTKFAHKLLKCIKTSNHSDIFSALKLAKLTELISQSAENSWSNVINYGFLYFTYELTNSSSDYFFDVAHRKLSTARILRKHKRQSRVFDSVWEKLKKTGLKGKELWQKLLNWIKSQKKQ